MRHQFKFTVLSLVVISMSACEVSDDPNDTSSSNATSNVVDDGNFNSNNVEPETDLQERNIEPRSPQGIPNNGTQRRNNVRGSRDEGRFPERIAMEEMEIRTYDGTSNNVANIEWGASFSNLQRLGNATYSDGISDMVYTDRAGAREISNTIVSQAEGESIVTPFGTTDMTWQWGQFIDHDIDLTDGSADEPENIPVPAGDSYFDPANTGTAVIAFNRALYDPDTGTSVSNARQQENEISSWIDGSMVYGSSEERAMALRVGQESPFLKTSTNDFLPFNIENLSNANGPVVDPSTLFLAGDVRANEQVGLAAMHTVFVREHNRLARLLQANQPDASGEQIFQAARRLVVAQLQIITYNEYLPSLIGPDAIPRYAGYDSSLNPTVYNEFSAAAYRLGHSMVSDQILRIGSDGQSVADGPLSLGRAFFNAPNLLQSNEDLEAILRGLATQVHQNVDIKVIHSLRNLLFGAPGSGGLDLTALNIQRGRDHGLPSYNDMRVAMELMPVTSFSQIGDDVQIQQSLQDAYGDVSKVDLWIGGLAETPQSQQGSQVGELFRAIIAKQFADLRDGDRFWYENYLSADELDLVSDVRLAAVIKNNTSIGTEMQNDVFYIR